MIKRGIATILLAGALVTALGCASISMRNYPYPEESGPVRYVYPGVAIDLEGVASPFTDRRKDDQMYNALNCLFMPLALIDLPFSFALDTVCLPYDVYRVTAGGMTRRGIPKEGNANRQPATPPYSEPAARSPQR